jgi:Pyruvate/2-oxoacid:ferredoxin oxidoreductase delta subunit
MRLIDEIIGYFELCSLNADPTGKAKRKFEQYIKCLNDLSKVMEEQEQVKPIKPIYQGDDSYTCDNCGETVGWEEMECYGIGKIRYKYCPGCGMKVKWDD